MMKRQWSVFGCVAVVLATLVVGTQASGALTGAAGETETGLAAVYSAKLNNHKTASGKRYNPSALTAAHQTLPFGTRVKVTNIKNGKSVTVVIDDRGPKQAGRILDLSRQAAKALGIRSNGTAEVKLEVLAAKK